MRFSPPLLPLRICLNSSRRLSRVSMWITHSRLIAPLRVMIRSPLTLTLPVPWMKRIRAITLLQSLSTPSNTPNITKQKNSLLGSFFVFSTHLNIECRQLRVRLDKHLTGRHIGAHENIKYLVRLLSVVDVDLLQHATLRVHSGFPKFLRIHLSQAFVTLDGNFLRSFFLRFRRLFFAQIGR